MASTYELYICVEGYYFRVNNYVTYHRKQHKITSSLSLMNNIVDTYLQSNERGQWSVVSGQGLVVSG